MKKFISWVQNQCGLKGQGETVWFLLLSAAGWYYFIHQYLFGSGLSKALPTYAGF